MLILPCAGVVAEDLVDVFRMSETSDPVYQQSVANYNAVREAKPQARAQLLPVISFSANTVDNHQEIQAGGGAISNVGKFDFNTHRWQLDLTQPVFRYDRLLALGQADSQIQQAQAELNSAYQDLIVRVSENYFNVLAAIDDLTFARAEKISLGEALEQAKQSFDVGLTAITDLQEAQAGYDRAVANVIAAENAVDNSREALREVAGSYLPLLAPLREEITLAGPTPEVIEEWTRISQEQNMQVIAAKHQLEVARQETRIQNSGHLPTLDIVGSRSFDATGGAFGGRDIDNRSIGLEVNIPLFQGGLVTSQTREAYQRYNQTFELLEQRYRAAQRLTREAYLAVISGISLVKALAQAIVSSRAALEATQAGFEVGTRTAVDVVDAQRTLALNQRDHARARYDYLLNSLRLKQAAGTLTPEDLQGINSWLE